MLVWFAMEQIRMIVLFITAASSVQGIFLALLLFSLKKGNPKANRLLAFFLLSFSISIGHVFVPYLFGLGMIQYRLGDPAQLLFGPLFYFYVLYLTSPDTVFKKKYILHFLPFCINAICSGFLDNLNTYPVHSLLFWGIILAQMWIYLFFSYQLIRKYDRKLRENFSSTEKINLDWLKTFITFLFFIYFFYLFFLPVLAHVKVFYSHFYYGLRLILAVFLYALGYKGMLQPRVFVLDHRTNGENREQAAGPDEKNPPNFPGGNEKSIPEKEKYSRSNLKESDILRELNKLTVLLEQEKLYLNPEFTLNDLSEKSGLSVHHLSEVINRGCGKNFYDFINSYRLEEFKRLLSDPVKRKQYTLLSLAYDAGFNSKATFNKIFKKTTGLTPSRYKEKSSNFE